MDGWQNKMNVQTINYWKDLILKAPKVEIVDDGWTLHVGGWQSRATIPLAQIDGVKGHCAAFWRKYPEEDEKLEFIFWGRNICGCAYSQVFKYENEPDVDVFLKKLIDEILPNLKLNLEGKLGIPDGADEILSEINDIFGTLEIPNMATGTINCISCNNKTMSTTPCCETHLCIRCLSKMPWIKGKLVCPSCDSDLYVHRRR